MSGYLTSMVTESTAPAADILTRNRAVDFDAMPRTGQLRIIQSHYQCYVTTAVALLDSSAFEAIVQRVDASRRVDGLSNGCAVHRTYLVQALAL